MNDGLLSPDVALTLLQSSQGQNAKTAAQNVKNAKNLARVNETAQEFEAVFIAEMMKPMFEGIETGGPFGGGKAEEVFRGMLVQEYGKLLAQTGSVGLSDSLREEMIRMQESMDSKTPELNVSLQGTIEHDTTNE